MNQNASVATADERETLLDYFFRAGSIKVTPRENFAGDLIGVDGIMVEAISTEKLKGVVMSWLQRVLMEMLIQSMDQNSTAAAV